MVQGLATSKSLLMIRANNCYVEITTEIFLVEPHISNKVIRLNACELCFKLKSISLLSLKFFVLP